MIAFPNAKINLGLNILRKRSDGYHDISSCFYPIPIYDALEIIESDVLAFNSYGIPIPGNPEENLCVKAYKLLSEDFDIPPVQIHLLKKIPMGAGLGGGSSDGAFMLKLLNERFELNISTEELMSYALQLGSDCPFFISNKSAIASGRGEKLKKISLDLSGYFLCLATPGIHVSTKQAYESIAPSETSFLTESVVSQPIESWDGLLTNDFERTAFAMHPEIEQIKKLMKENGAKYTSMSGSGSAVYGLFEMPPDIYNWSVIAL